MADDAQQKPSRSAADKDRSRQQSRSVSAKEAARTPTRGNRSAAAQRAKNGNRSPQREAGSGRSAQGGKPQAQKAAGSRPGGGRSTGTAAKRPGTRPPARGARPGRSRTALLTWGAVALVLVIVLVVVVVNVTSSSTPSTIVTPKPVPATILNDVTHVSPSVYNAVGTGATAAVAAPKVESGQPALTTGGKPEIFYMGGEFCPYCAAERWAIVVALSRFGTFSGLQTMASSSTDVYPSTQTFTFAHATYKSSYVAAKLIEYYGQEQPTGKRPVIGHLTKAEKELVTKYDTGTSSTSSGSIPFIDIGNKVIISGASFTPQILQGLTRSQIAGDLAHATNPVTQAIVGTSNYISAGICSVDSHAPASVCTSKGVQAASKALGLS